MDILRLLGKDQYDAAMNANVPTAANPFATILDLAGLGGEDLAATLVLGNATGGTDIVLTAGDNLISSSGDGLISTRAFGIDGTVCLDADGGSKLLGYVIAAPTYYNAGVGNTLFASDATTAQISTNYQNNSDLSRLTLQAGSMFFQVSDFSETIVGEMGIKNNRTGVINIADTLNLPSYASSQNLTINEDITNSFAGGGDTIIMKTSNSGYVNQLAFNAGLAGEMILAHTASASNFTATLQAGTGTLAYLSDIPAGAGDNMSTANLTFTVARTLDLATFNWEIDTGAGGKFRFSADPTGPPATKEMDIFVNSTAAYINALGTTTPGGTPLVIIGGTQPGARGISLQTPTNIIEWTDGGTDILIQDASGVVGTNTATWQNASGTVAYLTNITGTNSGTNTGDQNTGTTFIVSNDNTLRTIDANAINGNNLRDLVCTLIRDLNTANILTV